MYYIKIIDKNDTYVNFYNSKQDALLAAALDVRDLINEYNQDGYFDGEKEDFYENLATEINQAIDNSDYRYILSLYRDNAIYNYGDEVYFFVGECLAVHSSNLLSLKKLVLPAKDVEEEKATQTQVNSPIIEYGAECRICNTYNEYAPKSDSYVCYSCKH